MHIPDPKKGNINEGFAYVYDFEEETDNEIVMLLEEQYNGIGELNIQIQGDTTQIFTLKIAFPRAPFNALGLRVGVSADNNKFIYPNDVLELPLGTLYVDMLGLSSQKIFVTNLAEIPFENYGFSGRTSWRQSYSALNEEQAAQGVRVRAFRFNNGYDIPGGKVQITTPKGSFIAIDNGASLTDV